MKREPDAFGMYVYNDFAAYGAREVMENTVGFIAQPIERRFLDLENADWMSSF